MSIRTGDTVLHRPTGETWLVAWADETELSACGWPETIARKSDCELVRACSDEAHLKLLRYIAVRPGDDYRTRHCRRQLRRYEEAEQIAHEVFRIDRVR